MAINYDKIKRKLDLHGREKDIFIARCAKMSYDAIAQKYGLTVSAVRHSLNKIQEKYIKAGYKAPSIKKRVDHHAIVQLDKNTGEEIEVFNSVNSAAKATNTDRTNINKCLRGKIPSAGGYKWKYRIDGYAWVDVDIKETDKGDDKDE